MSEARDLLLKAATHLSVLTDNSHPVIAEIKEYLEEPEQEPVAWINRKKDMTYLHKYHEDDEPLYTEPPERKPFTEDQIHEIMDEKAGDDRWPINIRLWFKLGFKEAEKRHGIRK